MKKIFLLISPLIAFFLGGFILSFSCKAQAIPTPSNATLELIEGGNSALSYSAFSTIDALPFNQNPSDLNRIIGIASGDPLAIGANLNLVGIDDCTVRKLTEEEIETIEESNYNTFYDLNGNIVNYDDIYYVSYINQMYHGSLYVDSNGDILTTDANNTKNAFKLGLGGYLLNVNDIANIYDQIANELYSSQYNFPLDDIDISNIDLSWYCYIGSVVNSNGNYLRTEAIFYAPNMYDKSLMTCSYNASSYKNVSFYYNNSFNGSGAGKWTNTFLEGNSDYYLYNIVANNNIINGITYNRIASFRGGFNNPYGYSHSDFLLDNPSRGAEHYYVFSDNGWTYNENLRDSIANSEIVSFKKVDFPSTKQLQFTDIYDYSYIKDLETALNNLNASVNELFDSTKRITENNYPLEYELPSNYPDNNPSSLPITTPNVNPYPIPMPEPVINPSIGPDVGEVNPNNLRSTIPIINNLLNRFPFSIPWDIYGLLSGLSVQRETPYINTTIHIPCIDYDWVLDYDLSDFDGIASLFRTLFLIAFILGLAYFSYDHFFGS